MAGKRSHSFSTGAIAFLAFCAAVVGQEEPNKKLVELPPHAAEREGDVERLRNAQPIPGEVELGAIHLVRFGALKHNGRYPDMLITLTVTNTHGDADIYCAPWTYLRDRNSFPGPQNYLWRSYHSQATDEVFLSHKSTQFKEAEVDVFIERKNKTMTVVAFACAVYGASSEPSTFELELDVSFKDVELVDEERTALSEIYDECCQFPDTCGRWRLAAGNETIRETKGEKEVEMDFCHRPGSVCNDDGRLIRLDMRNFNLTCEFPSKQLASMEFLEKLDMDSNSLTGDVSEILTDLSGLASLRHFSVSNNQLSGALNTHQEICPLFDDRLTFFNVKANNVRGLIPECLFHEGSSLKEFHATDNAMHGTVPDVFAEDSLLEVIDLSRNSFTGQLPGSLGNAKDLRIIGLANNSFTGPIPSGVGELPRLTYIQGSMNRFTSLPPVWTDVDWTPPEDLAIIELSRNELEGEFPTGLGNSENLDGLNLAENRLSGPLVVKEGMFPALLYLNLSYNAFTGTIPSELEDARLFQSSTFMVSIYPRFDVRYNQLSGNVPEFLQLNATPGIAYKGIYLEGNDLSCEYPEQLRYMLEFSCKKPDESTSPVVNLILTGSEPGVNGVNPDRRSGRKTAPASAIIGGVAGVVGLLVILVVVVAALIVRKRRKADIATVVDVEFPEQGGGDVEFGEVKKSVAVAEREGEDDNQKMIPGDSMRS